MRVSGSVKDAISGLPFYTSKEMLCGRPRHRAAWKQALVQITRLCALLVHFVNTHMALMSVSFVNCQQF